jgi:uncharacterized protein YkwD
MNAKILRIATVIAVVFSVFSCASPEEASIDTVEIVQYYDYNEVENEMLDLINDHRVSIGLNRLEKINHISYKSYEHTEYMIETNIIGHTNFSERQKNLHDALGALKVGENVAFNYDTPELALAAWLKSDSHKANF